MLHLAARLVVAVIHVYQRTLSRLLGPVCRFEPSCSAYAVSCLETHGLVRGGLLSIVRLCKCHPFHPGGFDPPPNLSPRPRLTSSLPPTPASNALPPPQAQPYAAD